MDFHIVQDPQAGSRIQTICSGFFIDFGTLRRIVGTLGKAYLMNIVELLSGI